MIINANALHIPLKDNTVQCCVTSPPYYGLRDYGIDDQIGLESTPEKYVAKLVSVFREVKRVLKDDGVLWMNIGDSYAGGAGRWGGTDNLSGFQAASKGSVTQIQHTKKWEHKTIKPKDLIGIPWMVAFALRSDGWYLRSDIIWSKPNPMPESVKDRPTKAHEYVFLLSKSAKYYYDAEAVQEPTLWAGDPRAGYGRLHYRGKREGQEGTGQENFVSINPDGRNRRSVWTINTQPFKGAHFAVMPEKLVEPCILAGSKPGDVILDPFAGSGTVGVVAQKHGRSFVGIELNPEYVKIAESRMMATPVCLFNYSILKETNG